LGSWHLPRTTNFYHFFVNDLNILQPKKKYSQNFSDKKIEPSTQNMKREKVKKLQPLSYPTPNHSGETLRWKESAILLSLPLFFVFYEFVVSLFNFKSYKIKF